MRSVNSVYMSTSVSQFILSHLCSLGLCCYAHFIDETKMQRGGVIYLKLHTHTRLTSGRAEIQTLVAGSVLLTSIRGRRVSESARVVIGGFLEEVHSTVILGICRDY